MPKPHTVQPGECINSIAFQYGFFWQTVWDDPANAQLKAQRESPNTLVPGDVVQIPDKREKLESRETGGAYRFQKKGVPAKLKLQVLDDEEPLAQQPFQINIDGKLRSGVTDAEGRIDVPIEPNAKRAHLVVGLGNDRREYRLKLGHLQPVTEIDGVQARLRNLGFDCGDEERELGPKTRAALLAFQGEYALDASGEADAATQAKLEEVYGG